MCDYTGHTLHVLIETYWNVNDDPKPDPGINRNILECKYENMVAEPSVGRSINRNILECKWQHRREIRSATPE